MFFRIFIALMLLKPLHVNATDAINISTNSISIASGSITGVYYPVANSICRQFKNFNKDQNINCVVSTTSGSIYNLDSLREKKFDFALVQADIAKLSNNGSKIFSNEKPYAEVRSVFSLYDESLAIVVRSESGITKLSDIKGKRISSGSAGSGYRTMFNKLLESVSLTQQDVSIIDMKVSNHPDALCNNQIDVMIYTSGHPNVAVQEAANLCEVRVIPLEDQITNNILSNAPYYFKTKIKGGLYPGNPSDIDTIGVKTLLVTDASESDDIVYKIVKSVIDNLEYFRMSNMNLSSLKVGDMVRGAQAIEMHKAAKKYFVENNYMTGEK